MNWHDVVYDPGSTTKAFKIIASDYKLEVIFSDFKEDEFQRIIVIILDNIPVMIAKSTTKIKDELFLDILQNAKTTPIGVRLFASNSGITRGKMTVSQIDVKAIKDKIILDSMLLSVNEKNIYFRESKFSHGQQSMQLDEYILPGLKTIIDKYNI